jgi:hypothetical protein
MPAKITRYRSAWLVAGSAALAVVMLFSLFWVVMGIDTTDWRRGRLSIE